MRSSSPAGYASAPESAIAFRAIAILLPVVALPSPVGADGAGAAGTAEPNEILRYASPDLTRTHVPMIATVFRLESDFVQPRVQGFSRPVAKPHWAQFDIDLVGRKEGGK